MFLLACAQLALADADVRITVGRQSTWTESEQVLAAGGDLDDDGVGDVAIGVPGLSSVYLLDPGGCGEVQAGFEGSLLLSGATGFGGGVVFAPDIDGDGRDELLVAADEAVFGLTPDHDAAWSDDTAWLRVELGTAAGGLAAWTDGGSDLVAIGAPYEEESGVVWLFEATRDTGLSPPDAVATLRAEDTELGAVVTATGDLDGDGLGELAVTATGAWDPTRPAGTVYIASAPVSGDVDLATATRITGRDEDGFGAQLAGADLDGDGYGDLVASSSQGAVCIFHGPPVSGARDTASATVLVDEAPTVALPGDVDGDGGADVLVGSPYEGAADGLEPTGGAWLFAAPAAGSAALADLATAHFGGEMPSDYAGWTVAGADLDRDGLGDLVIGGLYEGTTYVDYGANPDAPVFLLRGR